MKKFLSTFSWVKHRFIYPASLYTILISLVFMLITSVDIVPSITLSLLACIFGYSIVISITTLLLDTKKFNSIARYVIHYIVNVVSFIGFWQLCYPHSQGAKGEELEQLTGRFIWEINMQSFIKGICFFSLVYIIVVGIGIAKRALAGKETKQQPEEEYKSIF